MKRAYKIQTSVIKQIHLQRFMRCTKKLTIEMIIVVKYGNIHFMHYAHPHLEPGPKN